MYFTLFEGEKSIEQVKEFVIDRYFLISCLDEVTLKFEIKFNDKIITFYLIPEHIQQYIRNKNFDKSFFGRFNE